LAVHRWIFFADTSTSSLLASHIKRFHGPSEMMTPGFDLACLLKRWLSVPFPVIREANMIPDRNCLLLSLLVLLLTAHPLFAQVTGRVVDGVSGEPVAEARITFGDLVVESDKDGWFTHPHAQGEVRIRAAGYRRFDVPMTDGCTIEIEPFAPKAVYLSFWGIGEPVLRDPVLDLIDRTELNALVVDIKGDRGLIPYRSRVPLAGEIGAGRIRTMGDPRQTLERLKERGIYTIGRIVTFKDNLLAEAHPEWALRTADGAIWRDREGLAWVDPFHPEVWEYNIAIAEEAARLGFDEIQFDYVRFPDQGGAVHAMENTEANRVFIISRFLETARERLKPFNVFLAADIFGYVCWNRDDTAIGQRLEELAEVVDYLSPMLYPSGFQHGVGEYRNPVANPFEIVYLTLEQARRRAELPARRFRPWLQAFRDYAFDRRVFGPEAILQQTSASDRFGSSGWMLWNPRNVYRGLGLGEERLSAEFRFEPVGDDEG
jgi:hypothetical protein